MELHYTNARIMLVCILGLGLSVYAFIVESKLESDKNYEPMCDIHEKISCSKAFTSEYGKGFGIISPNSILYKPNSFYGIIFYTSAIILSMINTSRISKLLLFLSILCNLSSVYFAYILYYILSDFCIVCVTLYGVNAFLFKYAYLKYKIVNEMKCKCE